MSCGTPAAPFVLVYPDVHFEAVDGDALATDAEFSQGRANFPVKAYAVHAQVVRGIAKPDQAGLNLSQACLSSPLSTRRTS